MIDLMCPAVLVQYEPGKRHWLKVKKDYLQDGMMADSADLVILGTDISSWDEWSVVTLPARGQHGKGQEWRQTLCVSYGLL